MNLYPLMMQFGGKLKSYKKNEIIFTEGNYPLYFFLIHRGKIKQVNYNEDGKEFIQGFFEAEDCFGEPPILGSFPYPSSAVAITHSEIVFMTVAHFYEMLEVVPKVQMFLLKRLAHRLHQKSVIARENINKNTPRSRIISFLDFEKSKTKLGAEEASKVYIPFTRQELASLIGMRVETVIRTLARLHEEQIVEIRDHKLYY